MHSILPFLLAMIAAIVLLNLLAAKLRVAYPILLVMAGLVVGFVPGLPAVKVNPDLIFFIFLPPLLFEASWSISIKEMRKWWRIITSFAFLVVFFTASTVALFTNYLIPGFSLALGFLLGGIVSPPDAVSTGAITRFVKIPRSTATILEGESLMNDASSLIIFRFALVAVGTGQFVWHEAALSFSWMVLGGAGIGLLLGWLFVRLHKIMPTDASSDIALTLIEPYFMYWIAEQLHSSGVLAVVAGGLYMSSRRMIFLNSTSRIKGFSVWESFVFILNGVIFLLIGLELPEIVRGIRNAGISIGTAVYYGLMVTVILVVARIVSSYAALITTMIFRPGVLRRDRNPRRQWLAPLLLGWTGMRGVVSLAAALAIPVTMDNGQVFPQRDLILFITFEAILLTLVVQGLTLPYLIKRTRFLEEFTEEPDEEQARIRVRQALREHTYQYLKEKYDGAMHDHAGLQLILRHWEEKTQAINDNWMNESTKRIILGMLESQREYLSALNDDRTVDEEIIRDQLYQIDLEEERIRRG